jgi:two-component system NarL family response regulator
MQEVSKQRQRIRVLVVDDHLVVRKGIAAILAVDDGFQLVAEASSGEEAIDVYRQHHPDVVLMDLRLQGPMDGIDAIQAICREWSKARILVLTTYSGDENIHRALEAGARGYLIKDMVDQRLFTAIRVIHEGRRYVPAEVAVRLAEHGPRVDLTDREKEVLILMARGLRNRELGQELGITEATARTHVENISAKLGVSTRTEAVVLAIQRGFIRVD